MQSGRKICFGAIRKSARTIWRHKFANPALHASRDKAAPCVRNRLPAYFRKELINPTADDFVSWHLEGNCRGVIQIDKTTVIVGHQDDVQRRHRRCLQKSTGRRRFTRGLAGPMQVQTTMSGDMRLQ